MTAQDSIRAGFLPDITESQSCENAQRQSGLNSSWTARRGEELEWSCTCRSHTSTSPPPILDDVGCRSTFESRRASSRRRPEAAPPRNQAQSRASLRPSFTPSIPANGFLYSGEYGDPPFGGQGHFMPT